MEKYLRKSALLIVALALMMTFAGGIGAQDGMKSITTAFLSGDVPTIDPSIGTDTSSISIVQNTYIGLTTLHEVTAEIEPGIAHSWELDGNTFTFHLMEGVQWVRYDTEAGEVVGITDADGNPRYVTAHDVVYGWNRTFDPDTASDYAYVLASWVAGCTVVDYVVDCPAGAQVVALDDYTLQVTASNLTSFVPSIYGMWMAMPQLQEVVEGYGDEWTEAGNYPSFGPFALKEWLHDESITITRNPLWAGTETMPSIGRGRSHLADAGSFRAAGRL